MNIFTQKGVNVYTLWCIFTPGQHSKEYPEIKFAGTTGPTGTSGTRYIRYPRYLKQVSLLTIGVLYFWKGGDTRISEIKFARYM